MCTENWNPRRWARYDKHWPPKTKGLEWGQIVASTGEGRRPAARYHVKLTIEQIEVIELAYWDETLAEDARWKPIIQGPICTKASERIVYAKMKEIIGACSGEETDYVKLHWPQSGDVHGQPLSEKELFGELKQWNRDEFDRLQAELEQLRNRR